LVFCGIQKESIGIRYFHFLKELACNHPENP